MNPSNKTPNSASRPIQDVVPPHDPLGNPQTYTGAGVKISNPISGDKTPINPIAGTIVAEAPYIKVESAGSDALDDTLEAIIQDVRHSKAPAGPKTGFTKAVKNKARIRRVKSNRNSSQKAKTLLPIIVAVAVTVALIIIAVKTFDSSQI